MVSPPQKSGFGQGPFDDLGFWLSCMQSKGFYFGTLEAILTQKWRNSMLKNEFVWLGNKFFLHVKSKFVPKIECFGGVFLHALKKSLKKFWQLKSQFKKGRQSQMWTHCATGFSTLQKMQCGFQESDLAVAPPMSRCGIGRRRSRTQVQRMRNVFQGRIYF